MQTILPELLQQPAALADLIAFYRAPEGDARFAALPFGGPIILTGMGASYHAAAIASQHLASLGQPATAMEAVDLLYYGARAIQPRQPVVYVSQSGRSGEVAPALAALAGRAPLIAVTNEPDSPLGQAAQVTLPLCAGDERLVASKSYTNTLAALWLACRRWAGLRQARDFGALSRVAERMAALIDNRDALVERLLAAFAACPHLIFLGHGPHAVTARQAAMVMSEWSKLPALHFGIGAFRHGFIETVTPATGAVIFAGVGVSRASAESLAAELTDYGAAVLMIENGELRQPGEAPRSELLDDEFLSPILDIIPPLLFTDALAMRRLAEPGFRHIGKVVTAL